MYLVGFQCLELQMKRANISTNLSRRKLLDPVLVMLAMRFASTGKKGRTGKKTHGKILTSVLKQAVCSKQQLFCFMAWKRQKLNI